MDDPYNAKKREYEVMSDEQLVWEANSGNDQSTDRKLARQMLYAREQARSNKQFEETRSTNASIRRWTIGAVVLAAVAALAAIASVMEALPKK